MTESECQTIDVARGRGRERARRTCEKTETHKQKKMKGVEEREGGMFKDEKEVDRAFIKVPRRG